MLAMLKTKNHQITECSSLSSVASLRIGLESFAFDHPLFALSEHQFVIEDDEAESESELSLGSRSFLHRVGLTVLSSINSSDFQS